MFFFLKSNKQYLITLISFCIFFWILNYGLTKIFLKSTIHQTNVKMLLKNLKSCIKEAANVNYNETDKFFSEVSGCTKSHLKIDESQIDFFHNNVHNEKKVFLQLTDDYIQAECKWLTLGIGGSTAAEENFHLKYPKCRIYGVDPTNQGNFSKIGNVLPFGVGKCSMATYNLRKKFIFEVYLNNELIMETAIL